MISFETIDIEKPDLDYDRIGGWLNIVAEKHKRHIGRLCYLFCNDEEILRVNKEFLKHDYFTDIITFDYSRGNKVSGDLLISLDTVYDNAIELNVNPETELLRVIVHGLLHLCGIDDKGPGEREVMEMNENEALSVWNKNFDL